jgi:hypothetical protein
VQDARYEWLLKATEAAAEAERAQGGIYAVYTRFGLAIVLLMGAVLFWVRSMRVR